MFAAEKKQETQGSSSSQGSGGSSSGSSGGSSSGSSGGSSKSSDKKQENNQTPAAPTTPAPGQVTTPPAAAQTPKTPAVSQKNQETVTPSGNGSKNESLLQQEPGEGTGEYDAMASADEIGGEDMPEAGSDPASQPMKELEGKETTGTYENAQEGEDRGFWLVLAAILGVGVLGMGGIAIAHSIRKF